MVQCCLTMRSRLPNDSACEHALVGLLLSGIRSQLGDGGVTNGHGLCPRGSQRTNEDAAAPAVTRGNDDDGCAVPLGVRDVASAWWDGSRDWTGHGQKWATRVDFQAGELDHSFCTEMALLDVGSRCRRVWHAHAQSDRPSAFDTWSWERQGTQRWHKSTVSDSFGKTLGTFDAAWVAAGCLGHLQTIDRLEILRRPHLPPKAGTRTT
jgi:hypothetical protein